MGNAILENASWIVICKVIQAILNLGISMLTARYLGPANFGLINYAASIVAFMVPVMQLGFRSTLVQEIIQKPLEEGKTIGTALVFNFTSSLLCIFSVFVFVVIVNVGETEAIIVCCLYSMNLCFQAIEMIQYWFQAKLLSKYTSMVSVSAYFIVSLYKIYLLVSRKNIYWFSIAQAIDYGLIAISLIIIYKKLGGQKLTFSFVRGKEMINRSKHYILSSMMVMIFSQTDRFMLKIMLGDSETGYYSAAMACASMTSFVFAAIIDSMRPVILNNKKNGSELYETNMSRLFSIVFYLSLLQCIGMTLLAEPIIYIMYGNQYRPAIEALRIVVWFATYSYFGTVRNIWILAEGKQKYLLLINLVGAAMNIILNSVLIPTFGIVGASVASVCTQFFTNFVLGFIINSIKGCNKLMLRGMNPCFLIKELRDVLGLSK